MATTVQPVRGTAVERDQVEPVIPSDGVTAAERWLFSCPLWVLTAATLTLATVVHGYGPGKNMTEVVRLVADPFTADPRVGAWSYSSPLGAITAWAIGARSSEAIQLVAYLITIISVSIAVTAVWRWVSDYAARLFLLAYFCSPQSWAGTDYLGQFDIITVAGITLCAIGPTWAAVAAGMVVGFNHFEQGGFALVAVAVIRLVIRREQRSPVVGAFVGLLIGKAFLMMYLIANGLPTSGRTDFIKDKGLETIVRGWWGRHFLTLEWAVYNVLWVAVIWMLWQMTKRDRWIVIGLQVFLTLPVLLTYDLSRVYRTVTWPIVILTVLFAAEHWNRPLVRRSAVVLAVAAAFVPRTEVWHYGQILN